jgi:hypothetical protein
MVLFRLRMAGTLSRKRLGGALACLACIALGGAISALALATVLVVILVAVIVAEQLTGARRRARGELSPIEALR